MVPAQLRGGASCWWSPLLEDWETRAPRDVSLCLDLCIVKNGCLEENCQEVKQKCRFLLLCIVVIIDTGF